MPELPELREVPTIEGHFFAAVADKVYVVPLLNSSGFDVFRANQQGGRQVSRLTMSRTISGIHALAKDLTESKGRLDLLATILRWITSA